MHFSFVVLHYQNAEVTRQCIQWLNEIDYPETISIVLVDNASPNGTGRELYDEYNGRNNCHVLLLKENLGFAMGNNKGYAYARETLHADVILVINSDLFIQDRDFLVKLEEQINNNSEDYLLAVDIVSAYGGHQNPFRIKPIPSTTQKKIIIRKRIGQIIYAIPFLNTAIINRKPKSSTAKNVLKEENELFDIVPHGACVIYTKNWTKEEEFAFLEGTFLFVEEEILFDYCAHKGYRIHYIPSLEVFHMEDASQNADSNTAIRKKQNQLKHEIESRIHLLRLRKKYENI
jgi:GT2 family glycosyltransferase